MVFLTVVSTTLLAVSAATGCVDDVPALRRQLFDFNERPTRVNERAAFKRLKSLDPESLRECENWQSVIEAMEKYTQRVVARAAKGDPAALAFGFRVRKFSDGDYSESLDIDLGKAIAKHPKEFLRALKNEWGESTCDPGLVSNLDQEEDSVAGQKMIADRRRALESVTDPELEKLKRACLKAMP